MRLGLRSSAYRLLLALAPVAAACSDTSGPGGNHRLSLHLTDAPGDFLSAVVTIEEIYLQGADGRVTLSNTPTTVDLVDLANSTAEIVDDAVVPAGVYSELRFVISGAYIEVENASGGSDIYATSGSYAGLPQGALVTGSLQMPSFAQSGLKVELVDGELEVTADQDILVDFDVSESFGHLAGQSGMWVMHPVVKGGEITLAGTVVVTLNLGTNVTLPSVNGTQQTLGHFKADLDGEIVDFTDPDANGTFEARFRFLLPGTYELDIVPPTGVVVTTNPVMPVSLDVTAGATVTQAVTIATATTG